MFAYCENNPVNYIDYYGQIPIALIPVAIAIKELLVDFGVIILILGIFDVILNGFTLLEPLTIPQINFIDNTKTEAQSITETKELQETVSNAKYYGCKICNNKMCYLTPPMSFSEAYLWAIEMRLGSIYEIGKSTSWGLCTNHEIDAYKMALALGSNAEPIFDAPQAVNHYPHYHVSGRTFGVFKHFHVWYML